LFPLLYSLPESALRSLQKNNPAGIVVTQFGKVKKLL
jgi:hypothetical protein